MLRDLGIDLQKAFEGNIWITHEERMMLREARLAKEKAAGAELKEDTKELPQPRMLKWNRERKVGVRPKLRWLQASTNALRGLRRVGKAFPPHLPSLSTQRAKRRLG